MRWDFVIEHWIARLQGDAKLKSLMDTKNFVYEGEAGREVRIPSVEYAIVGDDEEETFNPIQVQVDFWIEGARLAAQVERRIRFLTHHPVAQDVGGERMWMLWRGSRRGSYSKKPGVTHKILFFEFKPVSELQIG